MAAPLLLSLGAGGHHTWSGAPHPFSLASPSMSHLSARVPRRTAAQLVRGRLPQAGSALPLTVLAADGPICQFGRAVYYWHAPCTSQEGHGFATMDSSFCACMSIASILLIDHRLQIYSPQDQGKNSGYQFHYSGENLRIFIAADKIVAPSDKLPSKEFD
uniref:Uncharacterized protein n=1 Tax=Oryza rufipogon TaxID=4529 RepID=A0A0E0PAN1_ORYRU